MLRWKNNDNETMEHEQRKYNNKIDRIIKKKCQGKYELVPIITERFHKKSIFKKGFKPADDIRAAQGIISLGAHCASISETSPWHFQQGQCHRGPESAASEDRLLGMLRRDCSHGSRVFQDLGVFVWPSTKALGLLARQAAQCSCVRVRAGQRNDWSSGGLSSPEKMQFGEIAGSGGRGGRGGRGGEERGGEGRVGGQVLRAWREATWTL